MSIISTSGLCCSPSMNVVGVISKYELKRLISLINKSRVFLQKSYCAVIGDILSRLGVGSDILVINSHQVPASIVWPVSSESHNFCKLNKEKTYK